ncbi:hypothetical protein XF30_16850 [Bradyrhizobium sp. SUTN9-2]|nr:hypothetical protein XF30_16850 [Bradyrhizobium sp. SUTN9-2]
MFIIFIADTRSFDPRAPTEFRLIARGPQPGENDRRGMQSDGPIKKVGQSDQAEGVGKLVSFAS